MLVEYKNRFFNPDMVVALTPNCQVWTTATDNCFKHRLTITVSLASINTSISIHTDKFITQTEYKENVLNNMRAGKEWIRKHIQDEMKDLMNFINKNKGKN